MTSWRSARGLPERESDPPALTRVRAVRCANAAWADWRTAAGQLVIAGRATCGLAANEWAREQLEMWLVELDDDALERLADALEDEATDRRGLT